MHQMSAFSIWSVSQLGILMLWRCYFCIATSVLSDVLFVDLQYDMDL